MNIETLYQQSLNTRYGVTEKKKQELDRLTQEVLNANGSVQEYQAIVDSLTEKLTKLQGQLASAQANKEQALNNKNSVDTVIDNAKNLMQNSKIVIAEISNANGDIKDTAKQVNSLINKLIYAAEIVNKLANLIIRKKATNPLISNELITLVTQSQTDANNAVALTLVALESVFTSQATTLESTAAAELEDEQVNRLYNLLVYGDMELAQATNTDDSSIATQINNDSIKSYLYEAYTITSAMYEDVLTAVNDTTSQLNNAKASLSKAQVKLASLQSGLAAANAAALAS
ncbi:hypothetical protein [Kordia jejudonensis]|uniref:hypothetical protein n=1 Tax=Kordia jejudonensis TaxID=1348245 RepID=UPI000629770A|nr:hypothetical protein [Kordia jejudonensis]